MPSLKRLRKRLRNTQRTTWEAVAYSDGFAEIIKRARAGDAVGEAQREAMLAMIEMRTKILKKKADALGLLRMAANPKGTRRLKRMRRYVGKNVKELEAACIQSIANMKKIRNRTVKYLLTKYGIVVDIIEKPNGTTISIAIPRYLPLEELKEAREYVSSKQADMRRHATNAEVTLDHLIEKSKGMQGEGPIERNLARRALLNIEKHVSDVDYRLMEILIHALDTSISKIERGF
jgi:hypothetical protein